jgi:hypothetical protein
MRAHFRLSDNPDDRQDSDCDNQQGGRRAFLKTAARSELIYVCGQRFDV